MTYVPDFSSAWEKLARAEYERTLLKYELGTGIRGFDIPAFRDKANRVTTTLKADTKSGEYVSKVSALPSVLVKWGLQIGDIVHNMRSALDHFVWQVALENTGGRQPASPHQINWPVKSHARRQTKGWDYKAFDDAHVLGFIDARHRKTLAHFQPYNSRDGRLIARLHATGSWVWRSPSPAGSSSIPGG